MLVSHSTQARGKLRAYYVQTGILRYRANLRQRRIIKDLGQVAEPDDIPYQAYERDFFF